MEGNSQQNRSFRAGFVAIVGRPNVGKSTTLNKLLGFKLAAATPKPQTTRYNLLGIVHGDGYQILLLDTPGRLHKVRDELDRRMLRDSANAMDQADLVVLMVEPRPPGETEKRLIAEIRERSRPAILAINKVDALRRKEALLPLIQGYMSLFPFETTVPISATRNDGLDVLIREIVTRLPESEPLFPPDQVTDRSQQFLAAEAVREHVYLLYGDELPRSTAVGIENFQPNSEEHGGKTYIQAVIYLERESQKGILVGKGGQALKQVGIAARADLERLLGQPVYLDLWVKARPKWRTRPGFLETLGF